jgi:serine/threonine protein kinase
LRLNLLLSAAHFMQIVCESCELDLSDTLLDQSGVCPDCGGNLKQLQSAETPMVVDQTIVVGEDGAINRSLILDYTTRLDTQQPSHIGKYEIIEKLGKGGFGYVYKARDNDLDKFVAIKSLRTDLNNQKNLLDEARSASKLRHRNVVQVLFADVDPEVGSYIVFEYIDGCTLKEYVDQNNPSTGERIEIIAQICEALHAAHKEGLVHRDVKPANILIDKNGTPFITDFGLSVSERGQWKLSPETAGTIPYMAPEQIRGDIKNMDGRTDIWSIGVVLYWLLSGQMPFKGTIQEICDQIKGKTPKPPSQYVDDLDTRLEKVCLKCLSKLRMDRYSNAKVLADELRALPTESQSVLTDRRTILAASVIGVVGLAGGLGYGFFGRDKHKPGNLPGEVEPGKTELEFALGQWTNLLTVPPQEVIWPSLASETRQHDPIAKSLFLDIQTIGALACYKIKFKSYKLRIAFRIQRLNSRFGFFWGFDDSIAIDEITQWSMQTAYIRAGGTEQEPVYQFARASEFIRQRNGKTEFASKTAVWSEDIQNPVATDCVIDFEVHENNVVLISLNSVPISGMADGQLYRKDIKFPKTLPGKVGLVITDSTVNVYSVDIKPLSLE